MVIPIIVQTLTDDASSTDHDDNDPEEQIRMDSITVDLATDQEQPTCT